jgi:hypothetical protein
MNNKEYDYDIFRQIHLQQTINTLQKGFDAQEQLIKRLTLENEELKKTISGLECQIEN